MENLVAVKEQKKDIAVVDGVLTPKTFDEMWRVACLLAESGLMPRDYNKNPSAVMVAGQFGAQLGLSLMASIQNIAVVNGHPSIYGDSMLALVKGHGSLEVFVEIFDGQDDEYRAICIAKRKGVGYSYDPDDHINTMRKKGLFVNEFSVNDAKRAGVWGGTGDTEYKKKMSAWYKHPKRMLKMRARSFTLRDGWPDILKGMHSAEELVGEVVELKENASGSYEVKEEEKIDLGDKDTSLYTKNVDNVDGKDNVQKARNPPAYNGPPEGYNMDGSKKAPKSAEISENGAENSADTEELVEPDPDWDPKTQPLLSRYYPAKKAKIELVANELGISIMNMKPVEAHQAIIDAVSAEISEEASENSEVTAEISMRAQLFEALERDGVTDPDELSKINEYLQSNITNTNLDADDVIKLWLKDMRQFYIRFRSWRVLKEEAVPDLANDARAGLLEQAQMLQEEHPSEWIESKRDLAIPGVNVYGMDNSQLGAIIDLCKEKLNLGPF
jgi:hypothetical protein